MENMTRLTVSVSENRVATVTISNPALQNMTPAAVNELNALLPRLKADDIRAVVFAGDDPDYFIRHFPVEEVDASAPGNGSTCEANKDDVFLAIENLPKPVIAALDGSAAGDGLEFAMACDIRVAKDGPYRFGLTEILTSILSGAGGTKRLPQLVDRKHALEMMRRARLMSPRQAFEYGLVEVLVPAEDKETALQRAQGIAADMAGRSPLAVADIKMLVRQAQAPVSSDMLRQESRLFADVLATATAQRLMREIAADHKQSRQTGPQAANIGL